MYGPRRCPCCDATWGRRERGETPARRSPCLQSSRRHGRIRINGRMIMHNERMEDEDRWPVRPILLAIVGALACLAVQQIGDGGSLSAAPRALMAAVATGAPAFGFPAAPGRVGGSMGFATRKGR